VHFPGMDDLEAAGELGAWARRNGVGVDFQERKIRIGCNAGVHADRVFRIGPQFSDRFLRWLPSRWGSPGTTRAQISAAMRLMPDRTA
jgi:hypothetical protein